MSKYTEIKEVAGVRLNLAALKGMAKEKFVKKFETKFKDPSRVYDYIKDEIKKGKVNRPEPKKEDSKKEEPKKEEVKKPEPEKKEEPKEEAK